MRLGWIIVETLHTIVGSGGIDELATHLKPEMVGYGLVRRTDKIDDSTTGSWRKGG